MAKKCGDDTAYMNGRLTLNPVAHLDPIGAISLLFVGYGWAKPVPVNFRNLRKPKRDIALVSLAGPVSNILSAIVGFIVFWCAVLWIDRATFLSYQVQSGIIQILLNFVYLNIALAIFNLIPIPPLDGSKILAAFLPERIYYKIMRYERFLYMGLIILIFAGSNFSRVLGNTVGYIVEFLYDLTFLPFSFL
jgi:Zn-dependent protease